MSTDIRILIVKSTIIKFLAQMIAIQNLQSVAQKKRLNCQVVSKPKFQVKS